MQLQLQMSLAVILMRARSQSRLVVVQQCTCLYESGRSSRINKRAESREVENNRPSQFSSRHSRSVPPCPQEAYTGPQVGLRASLRQRNGQKVSLEMWYVEVRAADEALYS